MDGGEPPAEDGSSTVASTADTDSVLGITFRDELWSVQPSSVLRLQLTFLEPRDISELAGSARALYEFLQDFAFELAVWVSSSFFLCVLQRGRDGQAGS